MPDVLFRLHGSRSLHIFTDAAAVATTKAAAAADSAVATTEPTDSAVATTEPAAAPPVACVLHVR